MLMRSHSKTLTALLLAALLLALSGCSEAVSDEQVQERWMAYLDRVGDHLEELSDAGAVVLWRPFHEMNGSWFWWSGRDDPDGYVALWRHMHEYFSNDRGLDRLLWIYAPSAHQPGPELNYPGGDYVDIVGTDLYLQGTGDTLGDSMVAAYESLVALGKPFSIPEMGIAGCPWPVADDAQVETYDYREFLDSVNSYYPRTILFQTWFQCHALAYNEGANEVMNAPEVLDRDEMPPELTSSWGREEVLSWLAALPDQQESRLIPGQFIGHGDESADWSQWAVTDLAATSEKWMGTIGADYGPGKAPRFNALGDPQERSAIADPGMTETQAELIAFWNAGGLINLSWHAQNPWTERDSWDCALAERETSYGCQDRIPHDLDLSLLAEAR